HDDNAKSKGGGLAGFGRIAGISNFKKEEKAVIAINLRIADTETTEVIETGEARGESSRKSNNWAGMAAGWTKAGAANSGNETTNFEETIIGEATSNAVKQDRGLAGREGSENGRQTPLDRGPRRQYHRQQDVCHHRDRRSARRRPL